MVRFQETANTGDFWDSRERRRCILGPSKCAFFGIDLVVPGRILGPCGDTEGTEGRQDKDLNSSREQEGKGQGQAHGARGMSVPLEVAKPLSPDLSILEIY